MSAEQVLKNSGDRFLTIDETSSLACSKYRARTIEGFGELKEREKGFSMRWCCLPRLTHSLHLLTEALKSN